MENILKNLLSKVKFILMIIIPLTFVFAVACYHSINYGIDYYLYISCGIYLIYNTLAIIICKKKTMDFILGYSSFLLIITNYAIYRYFDFKLVIIWALASVFTRIKFDYSTESVSYYHSDEKRTKGEYNE